jgi:hypothetical protein
MAGSHNVNPEANSLVKPFMGHEQAPFELVIWVDGI